MIGPEPPVKTNRFDQFAKKASGQAGRAHTFALALALVVTWGISGPIFDFSEQWQLVINTGTTIVTFLMVFIIQNSQNRDTAALQAKLDELIRAYPEARNRFIKLENQPEALRESLET